MASGYYHRYNVLKFRIMEVLYNNRPNPMTCVDISNALNLPLSNISRAMTHYSKRKYPYFYRLRKKSKSGRYRYKINKSGVRTYFSYLARIKLGYDLNLNIRNKPKKIRDSNCSKNVNFRTKEDLKINPDQLAPYIGISKRGAVELNLSHEDVLGVLGLAKQK